MIYRLAGTPPYSDRDLLMRTRLHLDEGCDYDHTEGASTDFEWGELERLLGEAGQLSETDYERLATALRQVLEWFVRGGFDHKGFEKGIARRVIAFCWVLRPEMFEGASLTSLARKLGLPTKYLSVHASAATREFGIRNRSQQCHGWRALPSPTKGPA
jgi:hypothetical protein